jgi:hypothetical protein
MELAANEFLEDDVNKFAVLARSTRPVGILSQATDGDLQRSPRFARVLAPHGYEHAVWGCVALHRCRGTFEDREASRWYPGSIR